MRAPTPTLTLVSHPLCPYVQRAAIVLTEKGVAFERRWVDLAAKPPWFLAISPLGKTPVLLVGDTPVFESTVICEYLDETLHPRLLPADPLERARQRSWVEFASALLNTIGAFYNAPDAAGLHARGSDIAGRFAQIEAVLGDAAFFAGPQFGLADAAFAPALRYFDVFDEIREFGCFERTPKLSAWRARLAARASVRDAVATDYPEQLRTFLRARGSALGALTAA